MNITFRDYTPEDKDKLLELSNKLAEYVKALDPLGRIKNLPGFAQANLQETLDKVEKYQGNIWMVEDEGKVVGYFIGVIREQSDLNRLEIGLHKKGEVTDLYLEKSYRGKGIGSTMLQIMEDHFKKNGCDSLVISVFAANTHAHETYKSFGFIDREIELLKEI